MIRERPDHLSRLAIVNLNRKVHCILSQWGGIDVSPGQTIQGRSLRRRGLLSIRREAKGPAREKSTRVVRCKFDSVKCQFAKSKSYDYVYRSTMSAVPYRLSMYFTSCIIWLTSDTRVEDRSVLDRSGSGLRYVVCNNLLFTESSGTHLG